VAGGDNCGAFESTDDCEAAAWWPDSAGERLTVEPFPAEPLRRGGDAGRDATRLPPELDTEATRADARPAVLRLGEGGAALLAVELRRHRRRLRPLAVEAMLTESESRTRSGERYWVVSGKEAVEVVLGLLTAMVNARVLGVGALAEVGDVWNSPVPVMDAEGAGGTMVRPRASAVSPLLLLGTKGGCAWESLKRVSALVGAVDAVALGVAGRTGAGGSPWFVRRREREEERETTLRTRSRRLPVDEEWDR
jgi:hypothetical protein